MNDKTKLFKKFLTTASILSLVSVSGNALGADKQTVNNPAHFNTGADWNPAAVIAADDNIVLNGNHNITVDGAVARVSVFNGIAGAYNSTVTLNHDLETGSIVGNGALVNGLNTNGFSFVIGGHNLTLNANPNNNGTAVNANTYTGLKSVDFTVAGGTLTINNAVAGNVITLSSVFANGNAVNSIVNVNTSLAVTDASAATIKTVNVAAGKYYRLSRAVEVNAAGDAITKTTDILNGTTRNLVAATSELHFSSTNGARNTYMLNGDIASAAGGGGVVQIRSNGRTAGGNALASYTILDGGANGNAGNIRQVGTAGVNQLTKFGVTGDGTSRVTDNIRLHSALFTVDNGASAIASSRSLTDVAQITLGTAPTGGVAGNGGLYIDGAAEATAYRAGGTADAAKGVVKINTQNNANTMFSDAGSYVALATIPAANTTTTFQLNGNVLGTAANQGNFVVDALNIANPGGSKIIVDSDNPAQPRQLGTNGNALTSVEVLGTGSTVEFTNNIDFTRATLLQVYSTADTTVRSNTIGNANINIGNGHNFYIAGTPGAILSAATAAIANGPALLTISPNISSDAGTGSRQATATSLLANGHTVTFQNQSAVLRLSSENGADNTFALADHLDSGVTVGNGGRGIIVLNASGNGNDASGTNRDSNLYLTVAAAAAPIGTARSLPTAGESRALGNDAVVAGNGHAIHELRITGDKKVTADYGVVIKAVATNIQNGATLQINDSRSVTGAVNIGGTTMKVATAAGAVLVPAVGAGPATLIYSGTRASQAAAVAAAAGVPPVPVLQNTNFIIDGNNIRFGDAGSIVRFNGSVMAYNGGAADATKSITFQVTNNIAAAAGGGGGTVQISNNGNATDGLVILDKGAGAVINLGTNAAKLTQLEAIGTGRIGISENINLTNVPVINVADGTVELNVRTTTIADAIAAGANVNIGAAGGNGGHFSFDGRKNAGAGNYDYNLKGASIHLKNANSSVAFGATQAVNNVNFQLASSLDNANGGGIVKLFSAKDGNEAAVGTFVTLRSDNPANVTRLSAVGKQIDLLEATGSTKNNTAMIIARTIDLTDVQKIRTNQGTLTVQTKTVDAVPAFEIGTAATPGTLFIDGLAEVSKLRNGRAVAGNEGVGSQTRIVQSGNAQYFNADSVLKLGVSADLDDTDVLTFKLNGNLAAFTNGGVAATATGAGIIELAAGQSGNANILKSNSVILDSNGGVVKLGNNVANGNTYSLKEFKIHGKYAVVTENIDVSGVKKLTVGAAGVANTFAVIRSSTVQEVEALNILGANDVLVISPEVQHNATTAANVDNVTISLAPTLTFGNDNASLVLSSENGANNTFSLTANLAQTAANKGRVVLHANGQDANGNVAKLLVTGSGGNRSIGEAGYPIKNLYAFGNGKMTIDSSIDIVANELNVLSGGNLVINVTPTSNPTTGVTGNINVGDAVPNIYNVSGAAIAAGKANLIFDAEDAGGVDANIALAGGKIIFAHADAAVTFAATPAANKKVTFALTSDIAGIGGAGGAGGMVNLQNNGVKTSELIIDSGLAAAAGVIPKIKIGNVGGGGVDYIAALNAFGSGKTRVTRNVDITGVKAINVKKGGHLVLESAPNGAALSIGELLTFDAAGNNILGGAATLSIDVGPITLDPATVGSGNGRAGNLALSIIPLPAPNSIFKDKESELIIGGAIGLLNTPPAAPLAGATVTVSVTDDILAYQGVQNAGVYVDTKDGGKITLTTEGSDAKSKLIFTSNIPGTAAAVHIPRTDRNLGLDAGANEAMLSEIFAKGSAPIVITDSILFTNVDKVTTQGTGGLFVQTKTIGDVNVINIGTPADNTTDPANPVAAVAGTLVLDATVENLDFATAGQVVNFNHENSKLVLTNPNAINAATGAGEDRTISLGTALIQIDTANPTGIDGSGIVEFKSTKAGQILSITGGTIGKSVDKRVGKVLLTGTSAGDFEQEVYAKSVLVGDDSNDVNDTIGSTQFAGGVKLGSYVAGVAAGDLATGELRFNRKGSIVFSDDSQIDRLNFNGRTDAATSATIADNVTLVIGGQYTGTTELDNQIKFNGANATLVVRNNSTADIHTLQLNKDLFGTPEEGKVLLQTTNNSVLAVTSGNGTRSVGREDAKFNDISIDSRGRVDLGTNLFALDGKLDGHVKALRDLNVMIDTLTINNAKIDLVDKIISYTGQATFDANSENVIATRYSTTAEVYNGTEDKGGKIIVAEGDSKITFGASSRVTLDVDAPTLQDNAIAAARASNLVFTVINGTTEGSPEIIVDSSKTKANNNNLVTWTNDGFKLTAVFNSQQAAQDINEAGSASGSQGQAGIGTQALGEEQAYEKALDNVNKGNAQDYEKDLVDTVNLEVKSGKAAVAEKMSREVPVSTNPEALSQVKNDVTQVIANAVSTTIGNRMTASNNGANSMRNGDAGGVAAGDESLRHGIWGTPFYSQTMQKKSGNTAGFKAKSAGGMVGFDTMLNDNLTAGIAGSIFHTDIKQKDQKAGDRAKIDTYMFSLYAYNEMQNNVFIQTIASFGTSNVKNNEHRLSVQGMEEASGKYDSTYWSGEVTAGYNYKQGGLYLTPSGGVRYSRSNDTGYKETGTTFQNLTISKKSIDKVELVVGGRASFEAGMLDISLTPEVHAFLNYDLTGKKPKVLARQEGRAAQIETTSAKADRATFDVGGSLGSTYNMMEYGVGYNASISSKSTTHTGFVKVRVNF